MFFVKSKHFNFLIILLFLSILLSSCQRNKVVKSHGIMYLENRQNLLEVNITNKNDVIKTLGQPHSKSLIEENTWIYIERTKTKGKIYRLGKNVLVNNNVLVVKFNSYGVLEEKLFYNKDNMKNYKFAKEETENLTRRGSFLQSFLSSLRQKMRTNSPKIDQ
tara:strand:+ start:63 stop:548 length:486 start_codon:yes stop_codon:yes gene_type:complete